jgi:hypothetical protein
MTSLADRLPPQLAQQIHPDWLKNEADYWSIRDQLLTQYRDQWIGFAGGSVIVAGSSPVEVFHQAQASGRHPYVTCVGREHEPIRMRRTSFTYDTTYAGEALPVGSIEFRKRPGAPGLLLDQVIPDTGADASALPWSDCQQLQLDPADGAPGLMGGVGGSAAATIIFPLWAHLDGNDYACRLQADLVGQERILGRDMLNRLEVLFRGPAGEVIVNS